MLKAIALGTAVACIPAIAFLLFSFDFSLGKLSKYKELKNNKYATWLIAAGMSLSLFIVLAASNFFIFHFDLAHFLPAAILGSIVVGASLKIGHYKIPKMEIQGSEPNRVYENPPRIHGAVDIAEAQACHEEYPFRSPEETEMAIKRWTTS